MTHYCLTLCIVALPWLSACNSTAPKSHPYFKASDQAKTLMEHGQPKQAAKLYQNLADSQPAWQNQFNLLAADAHLQSGENDSAKQTADRIDPTQLSESQRQQLKLIYAQIDLGYGNAEQALESIQTIHLSALDVGLRQSYYRSLAFANALTGKPMDSAIARIRLNDYLASPQQISENNAAILEILRVLPEYELQNVPASAPKNLPGWLRLSALLKQGYNKEELGSAIAQWRQAFPSHPASLDFLQHYLQKQPTHAANINIGQPRSIAVLLPESGPYSVASAAIREGLTGAYRNSDTANQPALRFYDDSQGMIGPLYAQAIADGAELIIGPLTKEKISELSASADLTVPVLALNHVEGLFKPNLYQFALSPIDNAEQLAQKARFDGHYKALILTPANEQGERSANYLSEAWLQNGGEILEIQRYDPSQHDFSAPIKNLLNQDESQIRYQSLRRLLGRNLDYTPRRRHDVDAILLNANPTSARSLNPQLRFYHAANVPVYATPDLYSGAPNPSRDIDLNNISFCDIPWFFSDFYQGALSRTELQNESRQFSDKHPRLIAMGIDAYNLVSYLSSLNTQPYAGATGTLSLNAENRITRELVCAKFSHGIPVATGYANQTPPPAFDTATDEPSSEKNEYEFSDAE